MRARVRDVRVVAAGALFLLLIAAMGIARWPHARLWVQRLAGGEIPTLGVASFGALQLGVAAFGILPASLMAIAAGASYGMWLGALISAAGTLLGGWIAFLLSRSVLRPFIARIVARYPASARFDEAVATEGWRFVCLMRMSPVMPFAATSYGLGLTRIGQRAYLLGTLASLPALFGYVALGAFGRAGLAAGHGQAGPLQWLLPVFGVAALVVAVWRLKRLVQPTPDVASDQPGRPAAKAS
jgi:uncharacterized membrane protein YdjX (TVP38/TMEM64 family)